MNDVNVQLMPSPAHSADTSPPGKLQVSKHSSRLEFEQRFREAATQSGRGDALSSHLLNPVREHHSHSHMKMPLHVTMKRPRTGIIQFEPNRRPPERKRGHIVPRRWIVQLKRKRRLDGIIQPLPVPHDPKIMPVQMPRMNLRHIRRQSAGVLYNELHHIAGLELIHAAADVRFGIRRHRHDIVPRKTVIRRRRRIPRSRNVIHQPCEHPIR